MQKSPKNKPAALREPTTIKLTPDVSDGGLPPEFYSRLSKWQNNLVGSIPEPIHEIASRFPAPSPVGIVTLAKDIYGNGLRRPIERLGGKIITGRSRRIALFLLDQSPSFNDLTSHECSEENLPGYVMSLKTVHSYLTPSQRAATAALFLPDAQERAHTRRLAGLKQNSVPLPVREKLPLRETKAVDEMGEKFHVSGRYVADAVKILKINPEVFYQIHLGRTSIGAAKIILGLAPKASSLLSQPKKQLSKMAQEPPLALGLASKIFAYSKFIDRDSRAWIEFEILLTEAENVLSTYQTSVKGGPSANTGVHPIALPDEIDGTLSAPVPPPEKGSATKVQPPPEELHSATPESSASRLKEEDCSDVPDDVEDEDFPDVDSGPETQAAFARYYAHNGQAAKEARQKTVRKKNM